jgi:hypothetical protein
MREDGNQNGAINRELDVMQPTVKPATSRILSAAAVRVSNDRAPVGPRSEAACTESPKVETRQRNGAISEIVITCGCGQRTVIECDYNDAATRAAKA